MSVVRSISVRLAAEVSSYVRGFQRAKAATGDLINELSKSDSARSSFQELGTGLVVAGAGIAAGLGLATRAAINWESAWAGVIKTVDGTDDQLAALETELRDMTAVLPATHEEIAGVAEAAGQLGVGIDDISKFTRVMIDMGEATNLSAQEAAVAVAQMANIMGTAIPDVDRLGATVVALGNTSATTEADIVSMAQRISGAGATIGVTEADVLGFSAALASVGISAEAGGSAISRAMVSIAGAVNEGSEKLSTLAMVAGMTTDEFTQAFEQDAARAIAAFINGLGRMQASGQDVFAVLEDLGFTEIRLRDALLRLSSSGDLLTRSLDNAADAWRENTALTEEAARRYETAESRIAMARNQLNDFAIEIGSVFLPAVASAADRFADFVGWFTNLPDPVKTTTAVVAAATAAILLLGGTAITAVTRLAALKASMDQLAASGGMAAVAVGRLRTALRFTAVAAGPATAAIIGIELAAAALERVIFKDLNPQIDAMTVGLERFNSTGKATGELARVLGGDLAATGDEIERILNDRWWDQADRGIRDFIDKIPGTFAGTMLRMSNDLDTPREKVAALDQALANMARAGAVDEAEAAFAALATEMNLTEHQTELLRAKLTQWAAAAEVGAAEADNTAEAIAEIGTVAQEVAQDVDALRGAFDLLFGIQMDLDRATIKYKQGMKDLHEELTDGTRTLDVNTQAGRDNRSAVLDQIDAIADLREANLDNGMSIEEANEKYDKQMGKIREMLIDLGFQEQAVDDLIEAYREIPESVSTTVETPGIDAAQRRIRNLKAGIDAIDRDVNVSVNISQAGTLPGTGGAPNTAHRHGGVTLRAQHGLVRANIFPPTAPARYAFAEPATGGEAFIPRLGDRKRSLAIADIAAGWHGGRVVAGSDGASVGGPWQWRGARQAAPTAAESGGGGQFTGNLYLNDGTFLGLVRGEVRQGLAAHDRDLDMMVTQGTGAAR